jgi:hypothetical protein
MGYYINPRNETKEEFLKKNGKSITNILSFRFNDVEPGYLPVVLLDNGHFTAAGICYDEREFLDFIDPNDSRPKTLFVVSIEKLLEVEPNLKHVLK